MGAEQPGMPGVHQNRPGQAPGCPQYTESCAGPLHQRGSGRENAASAELAYPVKCIFYQKLFYCLASVTWSINATPTDCQPVSHSHNHSLFLLRKLVHGGFFGFFFQYPRKHKPSWTPDVLTSCSMVLWRRQWHPTPGLLPGKSHGQRSLVGCSPWGRKSWTWLRDFTFTFHFHALEKEMATHSSVLAWRIPGMGSHRVRHDWSDLAAVWFCSFLQSSLLSEVRPL